MSVFFRSLISHAIKITTKINAEYWEDMSNVSKMGFYNLVDLLYPQNVFGEILASKH